MGVGKVPDETEGSCRRVQKANMTTLWATTTRHHHTENLSEEMHIYSPKHIQREGKAGGKKSAKDTYYTGKQRERNDYPAKVL